MYQWTKPLLATTIPMALCGLFYFETSIANQVQFERLGLRSIPFGLTMLVETTSFILSIAPLLISTFFFLTIKIVLSDFFNCDLARKDLWCIVAISNTPLLVYNWWFALNLSIFKDILIVSNIEKVSFMLGMTFQNFQLLNFISWILVYLCLIVLLLKRKVRLLPACIAVFLPSLLMILIYLIV